MDYFTITITDIRIWSKPVGHIIYKDFGAPSCVIFEMPIIHFHSLSLILQHSRHRFLSYHSLFRHLTERQLSGISGLMAILSSCFLFHLNGNSFVQLLRFILLASHLFPFRYVYPYAYLRTCQSPISSIFSLFFLIPALLQFFVWQPSHFISFVSQSIWTDNCECISLQFLLTFDVLV